MPLLGLLTLSCIREVSYFDYDVHPIPTQANSFAYISVHDTLVGREAYFVHVLYFKDSISRGVLRISDDFFAIRIPEGTLFYYTYLIVDTLTLPKGPIPVFYGSRPLESTYLYMSLLEENDSLKLAYIDKELEYYPENYKALGFRDCLLGKEVRMDDEGYLAFYKLCRGLNVYPEDPFVLRYLKAYGRLSEMGDSSYETLLYLSERKPEIVDILHSRYPEDPRVLLRKARFLNEFGRYDEALLILENALNYINLEWLLENFPHLDYMERRDTLFMFLGEAYKQMYIAFKNLGKVKEAERSLRMYCLNHPKKMDELCSTLQ